MLCYKRVMYTIGIVAMILKGRLFFLNNCFGVIKLFSFFGEIKKEFIGVIPLDQKNIKR